MYIMEDICTKNAKKYTTPNIYAAEEADRLLGLGLECLYSYLAL